MGGNASQLTEEELTEYKELTYLSRKEILHVYNVFKGINPAINLETKKERIPFAQFRKNIPEFKYNPFADRLCELFSSKKDGKLSFEDFLDLMSILSAEAPLNKKAEYAFLIFDFDGDGSLSKDDLKELVNRLTGDEIFDENESNKLINSILSEADLDNDDFISFSEFQHVVIKSSTDFLSSFHLQL